MSAARNRIRTSNPRLAVLNVFERPLIRILSHIGRGRLHAGRDLTLRYVFALNLSFLRINLMIVIHFLTVVRIKTLLGSIVVAGARPGHLRCLRGPHLFEWGRRGDGWTRQRFANLLIWIWVVLVVMIALAVVFLLVRGTCLIVGFVVVILGMTVGILTVSHAGVFVVEAALSIW